MNTYRFNSKVLNAQIQFTYNQKGLMVGFLLTQGEAVELDMLVKVIEAGLTEEIFLNQCKKHGIAYDLIPEDLSFECFWNAYGYKNGGSKFKASKIWEKLSSEERARVLRNIPIYKSQLARQGISQAYATTYLNDRRWDN